MDDYLKRGHMTLIPDGQYEHGYYIPHFGILKSTGNVAKLRVVFDASAKTAGGVSLNDKLLVGPKLQADIVRVLLEFRLNQVCLSTDVKQMFRNILILPEHRKFQQILWRRAPDEPIQEYVLNTVTYGLAPSPFLAIRTLHQLAIEEGSRFPLAAEALLPNTYVDDILT